MKIPVTSFVIGNDERQERDEAIIAFFETAAHILKAYQSHQRTQKQLRMSQDCLWLALGFNLVAGADGPVELAEAHNVSKQTLGKCLNHFIAQLKLTPLYCQRNGEARRHMSHARKQQLEQKN